MIGDLVGKMIIYIIMICAFCGAIASIVNEENELGKQFLEGINAIGPIFLSVAGIMAAAPYLTCFVREVFGPLYNRIGADASMAATTIISVDMGGYQLAEALAETKEAWVMAMFTGYMSGATIVFSIPIALKMLKKEDRRYLALGTMSGFLAIPIGVLTSSLIVMISNPYIRSEVLTKGIADYQLSLSYIQIFRNLIPLCLLCIGLAIGLYKIPEQMTKGFNLFGKIIDSALKLIFVLCVIEYFTNIFTTVFGTWGFEPIIADSVEINRALEVSGYTSIMLCGAFPMVYVIRKYLKKPLEKVGNLFGLSSDAMAGLLACSANALALFSMIEKLEPKDKVITLSFMVCGAYLIGGGLAFTANFQPTLIIPVMFGKLVGGVVSIWIAKKLIIPNILEEQVETLEKDGHLKLTF